MFCAACGAQLVTNARFCSQCGKPVTTGGGQEAQDRSDQLGIRTAPEKCAYCGGDGKDFASTCPVCGGQGSVLVVQPAQKCATCGGDGKDFATRCGVCGGTGWAHVVKL